MVSDIGSLGAACLLAPGNIAGNQHIGKIMSFLKKLFGMSPAAEAPVDSIEHEGYQITPTPISDGGQFRLCAEISREIDGETKTHRMIRADIFPNRDDAIESSFRKAKQMIGEQGDRIFK